MRPQLRVVKPAENAPAEGPRLTLFEPPVDDEPPIPLEEVRRRLAELHNQLAATKDS